MFIRRLKVTFEALLRGNTPIINIITPSRAPICGATNTLIINNSSPSRAPTCGATNTPIINNTSPSRAPTCGDTNMPVDWFLKAQRPESLG